MHISTLHFFPLLLHGQYFFVHWDKLHVQPLCILTNLICSYFSLLKASGFLNFILSRMSFSTLSLSGEFMQPLHVQDLPQYSPSLKHWQKRLRHRDLLQKQEITLLLFLLSFYFTWMVSNSSTAISALCKVLLPRPLSFFPQFVYLRG